MLVHEYASALCSAKHYITCGNINGLMFIKECNNIRFSLGELDTAIEFLCMSYFVVKLNLYMSIHGLLLTVTLSCEKY